MDKIKTRQDIWVSNNANSIHCVIDIDWIDGIDGIDGIEWVEGVKEINGGGS